jgi:MSHA pilin protein MshC
MAVNEQRGFTLIELVMVLVLIGILAAFVAPKLGNVTSTKAGSFTDKLRADMRYAQDLAMTRNMRSRIYFNGAAMPGIGAAPNPGYEVVTSATGTCSALSPASDPAGGGTLAVTLGSGDYSGLTIAPSMTCLEYDSLGQPYSCVAGSCSTVLSGMTVTVNANGAPTRAVTISPQTGAVN